MEPFKLEIKLFQLRLKPSYSFVWNNLVQIWLRNTYPGTDLDKQFYKHNRISYFE